MTTTAAHKATPQSPLGEKNPTPAANQRSAFLVMALNMSWQLAIVVLIPVIGGVALDKALNTSEVFTLTGLGVALVASGLVMWRTMQVANKLPVPKLSAAQKRAVKKSYDEDDE